MPPMTPPPAAQDDASVQDVPKTGKERAFGIASGVMGSLGRDLYGKGDQAGSNTSKLDEAISKHHQQRLNEARMHRQNAATYAAALATGTDPQTGEPLTDEKKQQYQDWYNASWEAYAKLAGVNKDTKAALQNQQKLVGQIIEHGQAAQDQQAQGPGAGPTSPPGSTPPASTPASTPASAPTPASAATPAPKPGPQGADAAAFNAPAVRQGMEDQRQYHIFERNQNLLHQHKMEEAAALQKAKAQSGARPRPVHSGSVGVLDARTMAEHGQVFMGEDGNPIDVTQLDPTMGLYGMVVRNDEGKWETQYTPFSPNQRTVTVGNETYAVSPMDISKMTAPQAAGADLGQHITPKAGTHEAAMIGPDGKPVAVPLRSTSAPATPGIKGRGTGGMTPPPGASAPGAAAPPAKSTGGKGAGKGASAAPPAGPAGPRELGALPPGTYNQLLQRVTPVRLASTQLFGDPQNDNFKPLASYADLMDSPESQQRVASAWNLIRKHAEDAGANEHSGDLVTLMRNYAGTPGAVAESEAEKMRDTLDALKPREAEALNRLFSAYGTVIGLRSLTKGSAAKFSARNMEQEVPIPGMNVRTKRAFYDKLSTLAEEVNSGWKGVPDVMLTKGERAYDLQQQEELAKKARGGGSTGAAGARRGGGTPPPAGVKSPEDAADEYIRKHTKGK